jgi:outer membrane receptor protein involved in Fe transport
MATPELSLRALYGQAFRAPTIAEMFTEREIGGGIDFVPNPDLDAERLTLSVEAGVHWSPDDVFGIDVAGFRYEYEDLMYFADVSVELGVPFAYQVRNLNSALMQGIEVGLQSRWRALSTFANYTYLDARDQSPGRTDDVLPYRPKYGAALGADVELRRWTVHGDARYRSAIDEVFLYPLQAPDAFWVFNGAVQYELNGAWRLSLKANNVLDAAYEEFARYRMPGRNWMFGVTMRF